MKDKRLLIVVLLLVAGLFLWFQVRPTIIKHDCSWIKMHTDAIPAKAGMTEEQLKEKGMLRTCPSPTPYAGGIIMSLTQLEADPNTPQGCNARNNNVIGLNKPQEYVPAKDWYRSATTQEYTFCLHDKGL